MLPHAREFRPAAFAAFQMFIHPVAAFLNSLAGPGREQSRVLTRGRGMRSAEEEIILSHRCQGC